MSSRAQKYCRASNVTLHKWVSAFTCATSATLYWAEHVELDIEHVAFHVEHGAFRADEAERQMRFRAKMHHQQDW